MADPRINVVLGAKDEASRVVKGLRGQFEMFKKDAMTGFGLGAGISAFNLLSRGIGTVVDVMGDAVRAAMEEEAGIAQLTRSIEENSRGWDGNIDRIEDVISAREDLAFSDGEQRESLRALVAVTKDIDEALRLQAIAMDLARLRGMGLASATELIGKVSAGNLGILSRYGIQLERGTTATEALAEIQKRAEGQAETYAETTQGKLVRSQIALENAMEDLGKALTPVVGQMAQMAADIIPDVVKAVDDFAEHVATLWSTVDSGPLRMMRTSQALDNVIERMGLAGEEAAFLRESIMESARTDERWNRSLNASERAVEGVAVTLFRTTKNTRFWLREIEHADVPLAAANEAAREMAQGLDLARGSFRSFWQQLKADQKDIRFFIRHPGKLRQELNRIEAAIARSEKQKQKLLADGFQEGDALALEAIDRRIRLLRGRQDEFRALGLVYGNATEAGVEAAFDPFLTPPPLPASPVIPAPPRRRRRGKAAGGPVQQGRSYVVGERGPELFTPGQSGHITASHRAGWGGGNVYLDGVLVGRIMDERLGRSHRFAYAGDYRRAD